MRTDSTLQTVWHVGGPVSTQRWAVRGCLATAPYVVAAVRVAAVRMVSCGDEPCCWSPAGGGKGVQDEPGHADGMAMTEPEDSTLTELDDLVVGLRSGDVRAFHRCYHLTVDLLSSLAVGMLGDRRDAEEAVQDAFVALARHAGGIRGDGRSVRAWLVRTVRNACIDRLRARGRRREQPVGDVPEQPDDGAPADLDGPDPLLETALRQLTERQRTALLLRHVAGMSGDEIADVIGGGRDAVYALVARAERSVRRHLERAGAVGSAREPSSLRPPGIPSHDRPTTP